MKFKRNHHRGSPTESSIHAGFRGFAGPTEYAGTAAYAKAIRDNRQAWVNHSLKYSFYPEHVPEAERQKDAERELDQFLAELEAKSNEFMVGQVVHALSASATPEVDAQRGLVEVARRAGDDAEAARREGTLHALLVNPVNWEVNRLVVTERSNRSEQPGIAMGLVAQSSSVAEASHAVLAYPRYPKDLGGLDSMS